MRCAACHASCGKQRRSLMFRRVLMFFTFGDAPFCSRRAFAMSATHVDVAQRFLAIIASASFLAGFAAASALCACYIAARRWATPVQWSRRGSAGGRAPGFVAAKDSFFQIGRSVYGRDRDSLTSIAPMARDTGSARVRRKEFVYVTQQGVCFHDSDDCTSISRRPQRRLRACTLCVVPG